MARGCGTRCAGSKIRDPVFKANLDGYLKQCAYYDILLGTKSLKL
jgi:conjugal transfer mating pair stabilization protein TraG